jgi:hypothetical protein
VRNGEILRRVKERRNILLTMKIRKDNWISLSWCRNCLLKHVIEGNIELRLELTGRRGRRRKQLLKDHKEIKEYWKM